MSLKGLSTPQADPMDSRRRSVFFKQSNFTRKQGGRLHHAFDKEKAPYPLSFDRTALDLDVIDHVFLKSMKGSVSFAEFPDGTPRRCLDLGCGTGAWILDALNEWPDCEFVGFDLVKIQPSVSALDPIFSTHVEWVHGNFLTTKLPFEDDEFDHIHLKGIARAVPETKWGYLFEEISRVLRPGGSIEMVEEDIDFPILPRWYTKAIRSREHRPSIHLPNGTDHQTLPMSPPPTPPMDSDPPHDHVLLESLFNSVFETRFINRTPTSILPSYFTTHFCHVLISPAINFPSPTLPTVTNPSSTSSDHFTQASSSPSATRTGRGHRKHSSFSSATSESSIFDSVSDDERSVQQRTPPSTDDELKPSEKIQSISSIPYISSPSDDTMVGGDAGLALLPISTLSQTTCFQLAFQLHRMYNLVLACQESMWEVLNDRIRNRESELKTLGWDDEELEGEHARQRFDLLLERYQSDMQIRVAIWHRMALSRSPAFEIPKQMSKGEMNDDDRIYRAVLAAQKQATEEEQRMPCRTLRVLVGFKSGL